MFVAVLFACCCSVGLAQERLPSIVATYSQAGEASAGAGIATWELRRGAGGVLASNSKAGISERWQRDEEGRVWYRRIFHAEETIVEYQPTDLPLGNVARDWARIASIIGPGTLQTLALQPHREQVSGRDASVYRGTRDGNGWEVWGLAAEEIPARVQISTTSGVSVLQLINLEVVEPDSAICDVPNTANFESIAFADLGDRHGDPKIASLLKRQGSFGHGH